MVLYMAKKVGYTGANSTECWLWVPRLVAPSGMSVGFARVLRKAGHAASSSVLSQVQNSATEVQNLRHTAYHRVVMTICLFVRPQMLGRGSLQVARCLCWDAMVWKWPPLLGEIRKASQRWCWSLALARGLPSTGGPHIRAS